MGNHLTCCDLSPRSAIWRCSCGGRKRIAQRKLCGLEWWGRSGSVAPSGLLLKGQLRRWALFCGDHAALSGRSGLGAPGALSASCAFRSGRVTAAQIAACGSDDWERVCKGRSVRIPCCCAIPAVVIQCSRSIGRDSGGELCTRSDAVPAVLRRCQSFTMGTSTAGGGIDGFVGCARSVPGIKSALKSCAIVG